MVFAHSVCFITDDVPRLARFYERLLAVKADINDTHVEIRLDGGSLILYAKAAAEKDMGFDFSRFDGTGRAKISFFVADVDAEYERLKALRDLDIMTPPTTYPWGARSMHVRDIDGNIVCFVRR